MVRKGLRCLMEDRRFQTDETDVDFFLREGYNVRGIVHVGANDGAEIPSYLERGLIPVMAWEPHPAAFQRLVDLWGADPYVLTLDMALGAVEGERLMFIPVNGDDEKTSAYLPLHTDGHPWTDVPINEKPITVLVNRFDAWKDRLRFPIEPYNTVVIDAQGMEYEVLDGFGEYLQHFEFLSVEMSWEPIYDSEASASTVIAFLDAKGFQQVSEVKEHDDVYFVRKDVLK